MQATIERIVAAERFNMRTLCEQVWPLVESQEAVRPHISTLNTRLAADYQSIVYWILRHVFLIELVKVPAIDSTKFRVRWFHQLEGDPRWCSFEECFQIAVDLLSGLVDGWFEDEDHAECLRLLLDNGILPYEAPLDYLDAPLPEDTTTRIHRRGNLVWTATETMVRTLKLRRYLANRETNPDHAFFKSVLDDKIKIKTYLTDRVLTGQHKTNREKRWEAHPRSVHFATRKTCMAIEYTLITQLCAFDGFERSFREQLQTEGILPPELVTFRCPITLDPMSFASFRDDLMNPVHGKSSFQVGHLNPLKLDDNSAAAEGHTADNISWISADGNRIQGSMSLAQVRSLLQRIAGNYEATGWI